MFYTTWYPQSYKKLSFLLTHSIFLNLSTLCIFCVFKNLVSLSVRLMFYTTQISTTLKESLLHTLFLIALCICFAAKHHALVVQWLVIWGTNLTSLVQLVSVDHFQRCCTSKHHSLFTIIMYLGHLRVSHLC